MDLLGLPIRVTVGRDFANGEVEVKLRKENQVNKVKIDNLVDEIKDIINKNI
jgi:prolyl-tRNA synthetase